MLSDVLDLVSVEVAGNLRLESPGGGLNRATSVRWVDSWFARSEGWKYYL